MSLISWVRGPYTEYSCSYLSPPEAADTIPSTYPAMSSILSLCPPRCPAYSYLGIVVNDPLDVTNISLKTAHAGFGPSGSFPGGSVVPKPSARSSVRFRHYIHSIHRELEDGS